MPTPYNAENQDSSIKAGLDSIQSISDAMSQNGSGNTYSEQVRQAQPMFGQVRNRDYVIVRGQSYTIDGLRGHFEQIRRDAFGLQIEQYPLMHESDAALKKLDESEKYLYDSSPYNLSNPLADPRIKSRFEFMGNFLMGIGQAVDVVMTKKRQVTSEYSDVNSEWQRIYAQANQEYGSDMGSSESKRNAWMMWRYPALATAYQLYGDFLDEIQTELDRIEMRRQITSRALSAFDSDAKQRNLFNDYKDEQSIR